jgi:hypothetical protein
MYSKKTSLKCPICLKIRIVDKYEAGKICFWCNIKELARKKTGQYKDITGLRFGKLIAVSVAHKINGKYCWNCICDCGGKKIIDGNRLRSGWTRSCGCISRKQKNLSRSSTYGIWKAMIQRCYDKKCNNYRTYGSRGITVCDRWRNSFLNFYEDMGKRPAGLTLDRIDVNGNYSKENCRWATWKTQGMNRRNSVIVEAFGKKLSIMDWAKEKNIKESTLRFRLKHGWDIIKVLTEKVQ